MKIEIAFARLLSVLFHPMLIPTLGTYLLFTLQSYITYKIEGPQKIQLYLLVFINTFVFPTLVSLLLVRMRLINSLTMDTRAERRIPYLVTVIFYFITYYLLRNAQLPNVFLVMLLGAALAVLIGFMVNFFWKISAHMIGLGGLAGGILALALRLDMNLLLPLTLTLLVSGLVAASRLRLGAHNPPEVYAGFLTGFLAQFLLITVT